ncbi:unnamed protein product [Brugia timori]|uniref:Uncharacterized protein n=1 Tax=Brugia timori TaxID=42155 RepID=A0A0R3QHP6_9BILA|nr:unnamed protein product [Brugia timori]
MNVNVERHDVKSSETLQYQVHPYSNCPLDQEPIVHIRLYYPVQLGQLNMPYPSPKI